MISKSKVGESDDRSYTRDRVIALSDGVFAIAITLLVLEIVPDIEHSVKGSDLVDALLDMAPNFMSYLLSFLVIGRFWDSHRWYFAYIHLVDSRVVWNNLVILLWVAVIPATAALLGSHVHEPIAVTLYAVNLLLVTGSLWILWRYVSSAGYLRREGLHAQANEYVDRYAAISLAGYALAVPAAFLVPPVSIALVFLTASLARTIATRILAPRSTPDSASNE